MNELQRTQWEVNLDLLAVLCEFELDNGEILDSGLKKRTSRIREIRPKEIFQDSFFEGGGSIQDDERRMILMV